MLVTGARSAGNSSLEPLDGFLFPACATQGLRRHEVSRRVIRIAGKQSCVFVEAGIDLAAIHQFHGDSVARKAVLWVQRQNFSESCDLIHLSYLVPAQS